MWYKQPKIFVAIFCGDLANIVIFMGYEKGDSVMSNSRLFEGQDQPKNKSTGIKKNNSKHQSLEQFRNTMINL